MNKLPFRKVFEVNALFELVFESFKFRVLWISISAVFAYPIECAKRFSGHDSEMENRIFSSCRVRALNTYRVPSCIRWSVISYGKYGTCVYLPIGISMEFSIELFRDKTDIKNCLSSWPHKSVLAIGSRVNERKTRIICYLVFFFFSGVKYCVLLGRILLIPANC